MNDSTKFKHWQEDTHFACPAQIKKFGKKVKCCACNKHECIKIKES